MSAPPPGSGGNPEADRSASLLASGHLPVRAQERVDRLRRGSAFTSDLSTSEFAAIRSVGFDPVGQVLGTCVYQIGYAGTWQCGVYGRLGLGGTGGLGGIGGLGGMGGLGRLLGGTPGGFAGPLSFPGTPAPRGRSGAPDYAGLPPAGLAEPLVHALREARLLAAGRMREECAALGGDGVVAVRLSIAPFPGSRALEFRAIGTAVRSRGPIRPTAPFLSALSGQDFAKLVTDGWIACGLAFGIAVVVRHDDWLTRSASSWSANNVEVPGYTALVQEARDRARDALSQDVQAAGAEGVVVDNMGLRIHEQECAAVEGGRDHLAEATVLGTAVARFQTAHRRREGTLPILRLDASRRARGTTRLAEVTRVGRL